MKSLFFVFFSFFLFTATFAANEAPAKKVKEVVIQTSAQCGMCEERLEKALYKVKGVKSVALNLENKKITILYKTKHTNADALRKVIANTGYDADKVEADKKAYEALPTCCQKGGHS
jgi:copper chaperone CopZ